MNEKVLETSISKGPEKNKLKREIGLFGVIFFLFGYVVGAGILIQAVAAAEIAGPALWLSFVIAGLPNLLGAFIMIYLVSAMPVSGGSWVYSSRLGNPFIGFIVLTSVVLNIAGSLALLAMGFGSYFGNLIPNSTMISAVIILIVFYIINILGVKIAASLQILMAICGDFLIIFLIIIFGTPNINPINLTGANSGGMFPNGIVGIFMGAIILSFSFAGFPAIIEISGEVKNPKRNVPLGVAIAFLMVLTVYLLVSFVIIGVGNWANLGNYTTLMDIGMLFFPSWSITFLVILVLIAIASSIHGVLMAYSRELFAAARDKMIPEGFAKLNKRFGTPHWSLTFFMLISVVLVFFINNIIALSVLCTFTMTIPAFVIAYIPLKMEKYEELTKNSKIRIKRKTLVTLAGLNMIYAVLIIIVMISQEPMVILSASIFYGIVIVYFFLRKRQLKKRGINLDEICETIPDEVFDVM